MSPNFCHPKMVPKSPNPNPNVSPGCPRGATTEPFWGIFHPKPTPAPKWSPPMRILGFRAPPVRILGFRAPPRRILGFRAPPRRILGFRAPPRRILGFRAPPGRILGFRAPQLTGTGLAAPRPLDDALPGVHQPPQFGASPLGGFGVLDAPLGHRHPFLGGQKGN
uniref:Uncharacterized protein n=1 Tax=Taeniopygia guttata TaxID=59729 RepID=A0A674GUQ4_TAEGU